MTPAKLAELEEKAKAATPGPWEANEDGVRCAYPSRRDPAWKDWIGLNNNELPVVGQREINAEYIAAASPSTILELLASYRKLEADLSQLTAAYRKAVEALRKVADYSADYSNPEAPRPIARQLLKELGVGDE